MLFNSLCGQLRVLLYLGVLKFSFSSASLFLNLKFPLVTVPRSLSAAQESRSVTDDETPTFTDFAASFNAEELIGKYSIGNREFKGISSSVKHRHSSGCTLGCAGLTNELNRVRPGSRCVNGKMPEEL